MRVGDLPPAGREVRLVVLVGLSCALLACGGEAPAEVCDHDGGPVQPAAVDCALVSAGTLCNSAGHTCTTSGRCAPFEWAEACGVGECPPFPCREALCAHGACMRWDEEDGAPCLGDNGQCSGGECKLEAPHP